MAAIRGDKTISEMAGQFGVHVEIKGTGAYIGEDGMFRQVFGHALNRKSRTAGDGVPRD